MSGMKGTTRNPKMTETWVDTKEQWIKSPHEIARSNEDQIRAELAIYFPAAPLPGRQQDDGSTLRVPATHTGDLDGIPSL